MATPPEWLALQRECDDLAARLQDAQEAEARAQEALRSARRQAQERITLLKSEVRKRWARESRGEAHDLEPDDSFRAAVFRRWLARVPAAERPSLPLPEYDIGYRFMASLSDLEGITMDKVADVVVEVLTGRAELSSARKMHRLSKSEKGPPRIRDDGATAWRVSLQTNTSAARRLHFWRTAGGRIELSKVGLHDDMSIVE